MPGTPRTRTGRPRTRNAPPAAPVRALDRGLAILAALAERGPAPLREVASVTGLAPSTAHRLLDTLVHRGFIEHDADHGTYAIGARAFAIGARYLQRGLHEAALTPMLALRDALGESVNLAVRDGEHAVYIHQEEGNRSIRLFTRVGARVPLHASGVGKALLAWSDSAERDELLARMALTPLTSATHTTVAALCADLDASVRRGFALDLEEVEAGVRCAAAPVRNARGVVAAISVSAPGERFDDARLSEVGAAVADAANRASNRLGWVDVRR